MKKEGLLQPYKVSTWAEIPDNIKDAEGYWYGDYYGAMAFIVNKDLVKNTPKSWEDLKKKEYAVRLLSPVTRAPPTRPFSPCCRLVSPPAPRLARMPVKPV